MSTRELKKTIIEYIWIDGAYNLRSKARTLINPINSVSDIPNWNFDGSSTKQADGNNSEVSLIPVCLFPDPFRSSGNYLALCECYDSEGNPSRTNNRHNANITFSKMAIEEPWYGLEQEYVLMKNNRPLGWPADKDPKPQGNYYCGVGSNNIVGRDVIEEHYEKCLKAGIKISGINAEVMLGQWEFQIGICQDISAGDHLWMARYILHRVCEKHGVECTLHPKPIKGNWNGSGCHVNYSTKSMRIPGSGYNCILSAIEKLKEKHLEHMNIYGELNIERLTGLHETSSYNNFTWGIADRGASIRIGRDTFQNKCGYLEDRRPASNIDPYLVTAKIFETTVL